MAEFDKKEVLDQLASQDEATVCCALVDVAFHCEDWNWAQALFLSNLNSANKTAIRRLSATCLGHLARIHRQLDASAIDLLKSHVDDADISGFVNDALDDIAQFLPRSH